MQKKQILRNKFRKYRQNKDFHQLTESLLQILKATKVYNSSQNVMLFYPLPQEINLLSLLSDNKNFSFPCICEEKIIPYRNNGAFLVGKFGVLEPQNSIIQNADELDLVIVPNLCLDVSGYRVGYGKGYYDRFIKTLNRARTKIMAVNFEACIVDDISPDEFDENVDYIVTEKRVIVV